MQRDASPPAPGGTVAAAGRQLLEEALRPLASAPLLAGLEPWPIGEVTVRLGPGRRGSRLHQAGDPETKGVRSVGETPLVPKTELPLVQTTKVRAFLIMFTSFIPQISIKRF